MGDTNSTPALDPPGYGAALRGEGVGLGLIAVIPARLGSTRLPGKPLADLCGLPMIERVRRAVVASDACDRVVVACEDAEIATAVRAFGGEAVLTGPAANGTIRVARVVEMLGLEGAVLNVQGDLPLLEPEHVRRVVALLEESAPIATLAAPLVGDPSDPDVVKVVVVDGRAARFSRERIPDRGPWLRHVGIYGFAPGVISEMTALPEHPIETAERLEQLRWMFAGAAIAVGVVDSAHPGVDTLEQLEEVRRIMGCPTSGREKVAQGK